MKLVYICSPYAGDVESNVRFAKDACLYTANRGYAPVAVHLLYPQILDDAIPAQREIGIRMGLRVLVSCDELWICGSHISHGMSGEISEAERLDIPIRSISAEQIQGELHMNAYNSKERIVMPEEAPSPCMKLQL